MSMTPNICILSTGRAGTTYLSRTINALMENTVITHQERLSRIFNILGNTVISNLLPARTCVRLLPKVARLKLLESTCDPLRSIPITLLLKHGLISEEYRVIHLVRDPRDFVTSFMNWKNQSTKRFVLHHIVPFWQPNPVFVDRLGVFQWMKWSKFEHFCWIWQFKNRYFQEMFTEDSNYLLVKMEDLVSKNGCLSEVFAHLELDVPAFRAEGIHAKRVNRSTRNGFPKWRDWTPQHALILQRHCAHLMQQFGYGAETEWLELLKKTKE